MDPAAAPASTAEYDEWDADGFEIPSLKVDKSESPREEVNGAKKVTSRKVISETENIYLGPHGAPPSQLKQQEINGSGKKHRLKHKLKEAERKGVLAGRENKVDILRDLMGSKGITPSPKGAQTEWLDPHCHESQFERST